MAGVFFSDQQKSGGYEAGERQGEQHPGQPSARQLICWMRIGKLPFQVFVVIEIVGKITLQAWFTVRLISPAGFLVRTAMRTCLGSQAHRFTAIGAMEPFGLPAGLGSCHFIGALADQAGQAGTGCLRSFFHPSRRRGPVSPPEPSQDHGPGCRKACRFCDPDR